VLGAIAAGGVIGAVARDVIERAFPAGSGAFPWATFTINLSGSLLLGLLLVVVLEVMPPTRYLRPFLATGVLGAFTTFSTFTVETGLLVRDGHVGRAVLYVGTSLASGLLCAWLGVTAGRMLVGRRG
jgi:CrcB protein